MVEHGGPVPLFDRLVDRPDLTSDEEKATRVLDREGVLKSVRKELENLLNTRAPVEATKLGVRSTLNYGIPDLAYFSNKDINDWADLSEVMTSTIEFFEPRIKDVEVSIKEVSAEQRKLVASVQGRLSVGSIDEPVVFPISISSGSETSSNGKG